MLPWSVSLENLQPHICKSRHFHQVAFFEIPEELPKLVRQKFGMPGSFNCGDFCNVIFSFWPKISKKPRNLWHNILLKNIFSQNEKKKLPKKKSLCSMFLKKLQCFLTIFYEIINKKIISFIKGYLTNSHTWFLFWCCFFFFF
jgi:hypothetical protein